MAIQNTEATYLILPVCFKLEYIGFYKTTVLPLDEVPEPVKSEFRKIKL